MELHSSLNFRILLAANHSVLTQFNRFTDTERLVNLVVGTGTLPSPFLSILKDKRDVSIVKLRGKY